MCSKETGILAVAGSGIIGIGIYSGVSLAKALEAKLTADTVCTCFCNVLSNISETACNQAFDLAFGKGLYPPYDVTAFCGIQGGCQLLQTSVKWGLVAPSFTTAAVVSLFALGVGVCVYKGYFSKRSAEYMQINNLT